MKTIDDYQADYVKAQAEGDKAGMVAAHAGAQCLRGGAIVRKFEINIAGVKQIIEVKEVG